LVCEEVAVDDDVEPLGEMVEDIVGVIDGEDMACSFDKDERE